MKESFPMSNGEQRVTNVPRSIAMILACIENVCSGDFVANEGDGDRDTRSCGRENESTAYVDIA